VNDPIIECRALTKTFSSGAEVLHILERADFSLEKGKICTILGPSGSGKSTFLAILGTKLLHQGKKKFVCSDASSRLVTRQPESDARIASRHKMVASLTSIGTSAVGCLDGNPAAWEGEVMVFSREIGKRACPSSMACTKARLFAG